MAATPDDPATAGPPRPGSAAVIGSVLGLWTLAISQPLLDLIGRNIAFAVAHRLSGAGIVVLAVGLTLALPLVAAGIVLAVRAVWPGIAWVLHAAMLAILAALVVLVTVRVGGLGGVLPAPVSVALALAVGCGVALGYRRSAGLQRLLAYTVLAAPAVALLFLLASPARALWLAPDTAGTAAPVPPDAPPVVIVIFDELPLATLLDKAHGIDATAFPSFARLAEGSTFFRNATASHSSTVEAVPALLGGRYTTINTPPMASAHPTNLFTTLGGGYALHALEPLTDLCTGDGCADDAAGGATDSLALVRDLSVLQLHLVTPDDWAGALPPTDAGWRDFAGGGAQAASDEPLDREGFLVEARGALREDTPGAFRQFVAEIEQTTGPSLHVIHTLMPHRPWRYLPDGRLHGGGGEPSLRDETWTDRDWPMRQSTQLHLAQTRLADRLLGDLLDRLDTLSMYDRSLVIVVADHGVSLLPGTTPRDVRADSLAGIAPVPLFVKVPGQTAGEVSDTPVETVDVAPTVLDVVGVEPAQELDGRSLLGTAPARTRRTIIDAEGKAWPVPTSQDDLFDGVEHMHDLFPRGAVGLFDLTPPGLEDILGRRLPPTLPTARRMRVSLERPGAYAQVDTEAAAVPALIAGKVTGIARSAPPPGLAIAVNGTVRAVTLAETGFGPPGSFRALVSPDAFRDGANDIEVLLIAGRGRLVRLAGSE